ncbi:MAG: CHAP domain-containing protein, partial [Alloscardovia omnicolens]|nr:CHAP domain-containing protein [Alloscardovia omnicolens]
SGNAYPFSQCTWWAYTRRHQLGLPVGSYFGNGGQWANSARALGYSVDNTPQVGDVMVFLPGQEGADPVYGHVAIVEKINADGSVVTSESGAVMNGKTYTRTISNPSRFQFIHE